MTFCLRCLSAVVILSAICSCWAAETEPTPQPKLEMTADERVILDLTNEARTKENLTAVKAESVLFGVARAHAANLAKKGELNHILDGKNPADRVRDSGYRYTWVGENIAAGDRWTPQKTFKVWMDSKIHKDNIMDEKYKEIGLGIARGEDGQIYYVQVFAAPR